MAQIVFEMQVVGGPYDGTDGLGWCDDGRSPPPDLIVLGRCPGDRSCGLVTGSRQRCKAGKPHTAYWTLEESACPTSGFRYEKQEDFVARSESGELTGVAIYVEGGLLDPSNFGATAREPLELSGAGASIDHQRGRANGQ